METTTASRRQYLRALTLAPTIFTPATAPAPVAEEDVKAIIAGHIDELQSSISPGKSDVWDRLVDADCIFTDENGHIFDKKTLVADIQPHPPEVYADIVARNVTIRVFGEVATVSFDSDEHETFYGHKLHARYRGVQTWMRRPQGWRLIAGQLMALLMEPPEVTLPPEKLEEYVGIYELNDKLTCLFALEGDHLVGGRQGKPQLPLKAEIADVFFSPDHLRVRKIFLRDKSGKITGYTDRREGGDLIWRRRGPHTG